MRIGVRYSLRGKLLAAMMAATLVALLVAGAAMTAYDINTYRARWISELSAQAGILALVTAPTLAFDDAASANSYLALMKVRPTITAAAVYNAKGKLFASYTAASSAPAPLPALPGTDGYAISGETIALFMRIVENDEILGTVYLRAAFDLSQRLRDSFGIVSAVTVASLLVALLISTGLQSGLTRPITDIAAVARQVMETRDFSLRAAKTTDDEIGYLVDTFNDMLVEIGRRASELQVANRTLELAMAERQHAEDRLRDLNAELEQRVAARTTALEAANKELEGFSYSVSHDLRAPLRAIVGFAQMLTEDHARQMDADAQRKLAVIAGEARRMGELIDALLSFSRLGRKALQSNTVDMTELVRSTFESLTRDVDTPAVEFRLASLPHCDGDRLLLGQVWANLLSNALKFAAKQPHPLIEVSGVSDEKELIYFVRDNGVGFDPRYQAKLFGVFQRLHDASDYPGTGVGLALVQRVVARHGGRVWADSRPGHGATFYFTLPRESPHGVL